MSYHAKVFGVEENNNSNVVKELLYTPTIVHWLKSEHHLSSNEHTLIVCGKSPSNRHSLQVFTAKISDNASTMNNVDNMMIEEELNSSIIEDTIMSFDSLLTGIAFAERLAIVCTNDGEIHKIKLNYIPSNENMNENEWNLKLLNGSCAKIKNGKSRNAMNVKFTSIAVRFVSGKIVCADELGFIHLSDMEYNISHSTTTVNSIHRCSSSAIYDIKFCGAHIIVTANMSGQLVIWDIRDLKKACFHTHLPRKYGCLTCLAVHPFRNRMFATGTEDGFVCLWDIRYSQNNNYGIFEAHKKNTSVNHISYLANSGVICSGNDGHLRTFVSRNEEEWQNIHHLEFITEQMLLTNVESNDLQSEHYPISHFDVHQNQGLVATVCNSQTLTLIPKN